MTDTVELFQTGAPPCGSVAIDLLYAIYKEGDICTIFAGGLPLMDFHVDDLAGRDIAIVQLCEHGGVGEEEAAAAFGVSRSTVSRAKRNYSKGGTGALVPRQKGKHGPSKIKGAKEKQLLKLARQDVSKTEIARRLGVTEAGVRNALRRLGFEYTPAEQCRLDLDDSNALGSSHGSTTVADVIDGDTLDTQNLQPLVEQLPPAKHIDDVTQTCGEIAGNNVRNADLASAATISESAAPDENSAVDQAITASGDDCGLAVSRALNSAPELEVATAEITMDVDPENRSQDRLWARLGLLDDAAPLFGNRSQLPRAGLLLAVPILVAHGVFADALKLFRNIGPAFYGARNSVMALLMMFLSRINRPEALKEHCPKKLGAVIGLDRFPEMKTLRRKIRVLAALKQSLTFLNQLCRRHLSRLQASQLWLYIDGHVSVYSGKNKLKKHHVTRLRISLPSMLDYWLNDVGGDPLFVVTGVQKKMMVKLIPEKVRELREQGEQRPITILFDREGWSPAMFATLMNMDGVYFVSYRKAKANERLPVLQQSVFSTHKGNVDGLEFEYELADKGVYIKYGAKRMPKQLHLRQVTRLSDNGHQTHIVTNHWHTSAFTIAHGMFGRWSQENYLKYMRQEMDLDALYTYLMEDTDGERMVKNPERQKIAKQHKQLQESRAKLVAEYGKNALDNPEGQRPTMRGFKIANAKLAENIRELDAEIEALVSRQAALQAQISIKELLNGDEPKQAHVETRRLIHCFRIATFRAETALRELIRPNYSRWRQDGRTMVQSMLQSSGDLKVTQDELHVILEPQSSPHRTRLLAALCEDVNQLNAKFPGTDLRLQFSVRTADFVS